MLTKPFFDSIRPTLFQGAFSGEQVAALNAIDTAWAAHGDGQVDSYAYSLATIYNEVGPTLQPHAEDLNYSAPRLCQVWPSRFPTIAAAMPYAHNPQKLGNHVYANILGNGNEASGDGYKYRGHGYQTTGRQHFTTFAQRLGVDLVGRPEMLDGNVELAAAALIIGMKEGIYTGKSFSSYLDHKDEPDAEDLREFINARRIVNGTFNAQAIGHYALNFEHALRAE